MTSTTEIETVNRQGWAKGPWDWEPDRISWRTRTGLPAMIMRNPTTGALSGYVGVPEGHPHHGHTTGQLGLARYAITYAGQTPQEQKPSRNGHWWFGFHCAHGGQYAPQISKATEQMPAREPTKHESYWDIGMVIHDTERIASVIHEQAERVTSA